MLAVSLFSVVAVLATTVLAASAPECGNITIGFHPAVCDDDQNLLPWNTAAAGNVSEALLAVVTAEMNWYAAAPATSHGFASYVYSTFVDGSYEPILPKGLSIIPAMQLGMGIISYLKFYHTTGSTNAQTLARARDFAEYMIADANTPSPATSGPFGGVTRSSGINLNWPIATADQSDIWFGADTIEPDKVALAGYALLQLYVETGNATYLTQAVANANALVASQLPGNETHSPWCFRVNAMTGACVDPNGWKNGNTVFPLRLFQSLVKLQYAEYIQPATDLWNFISTYQLTVDNYNRNASLFVNFFEDQTEADNRNSWTALELARYLTESKSDLDTDWIAHSAYLLNYAIDNFGVDRTAYGNVTGMGEQDADHKTWGGANSKLGGVAALFGCAVQQAAKEGAITQSEADAYAYFSQLGANNLSWMSYYVDTTGSPSDSSWLVNSPPTHGGWVEDAHTDVVHNFVDGINAFNGIC